MNNVRFSVGLLQQLGGNTYLGRPAYFESAALLSNDVGLVLDGVKAGLPPLAQAVDWSSSAASSEQVDSAVGSDLIMSLPAEPNSVVVLGAGLSSIWQDESKPEWLLMQNICEAFGWVEEQLRFFDTDTLVSEEAVFTTMEEVIEVGVEWVLSMDSEHPISEQLSEGVQVIEVPDLEQMLSDPYAKQSFYQAVYPLLNS